MERIETKINNFKFIHYLMMKKGLFTPIEVGWTYTITTPKRWNTLNKTDKIEVVKYCNSWLKVKHKGKSCSFAEVKIDFEGVMLFKMRFMHKGVIDNKIISKLPDWIYKQVVLELWPEIKYKFFKSKKD